MWYVARYGQTWPLTNEGGTLCHAGQIQTSQGCVDCPDNTYSVGNGVVYTDFDSASIAPFETYCGNHHIMQDCNSLYLVFALLILLPAPWSVSSRKLVSGHGNSTLMLQAAFHFGQDSVEFSYDVAGHGYFTFWVDSEENPRFQLRTPVPQSGVYTV